MLNPADPGEMRVYNQFTESFSIRDLAVEVQHAAKELGLDVEIGEVENPRTEAQEHYYNPTHTKLLDLGLKPTLLSEDLVTETLSTRSSATRTASSSLESIPARAGTQASPFSSKSPALQPAGRW